MAAPNHTHRRKLSDYLKAAGIDPYWSKDNAKYVPDALDAWWKEINTYCTDAAKEYHRDHPDRAKLTRLQQSLKTSYEGYTRVRRDLISRPPTTYVNELDNIYDRSGVAAIVKLPPLPAGHDWAWFKTGDANWTYFFVKTAIGLGETDLKSLHAAMVQDPESGTTTNVGGALRHQSSRCTGRTAGMIWYVHQYKDNRLLAVDACDPKKLTISVLREGNVNAGVHRF